MTAPPDYQKQARDWVDDDGSGLNERDEDYWLTVQELQSKLESAHAAGIEAGRAAEREEADARMQAFALDAVTKFALAVKQTLTLDMAKIVDRIVVRASDKAVKDIATTTGASAEIGGADASG